MVASAATIIQVTATTRSGSMPESSARSSLSEKARIDLPVRVRFRNQKSAATAMTATIRVIAWVVRIASPSSSPVSLAEVAHGEEEARAVGEVAVVGADDAAARCRCR